MIALSLLQVTNHHESDHDLPYERPASQPIWLGSGSILANINKQSSHFNYLPNNCSWADIRTIAWTDPLLKHESRIPSSWKTSEAMVNLRSWVGMVWLVWWEDIKIGGIQVKDEGRIAHHIAETSSSHSQLWTKEGPCWKGRIHHGTAPAD